MKSIWLFLGLSFACSAAGADDWMNWRGPHYNGSADARRLPTEWSRTENVAWSVALSGVAASTPIVVGDRVLLTSTDAAEDELLAICLDRRDGSLLWRHAVAKGIQKDYRSNFASSSPVTDGEHAIFFFGSGDLACYDMQGKAKWSRNLQEDFGEFAFFWTFSSTPLLYQGKLYVQVLQRDVSVEGRGFSDRENHSYLLALDPASGDVLWRQIRPSQAVAESREAFTTPIPFTSNGRTEILVAGGDAITGHDPDSGKELWRWGTWNPERIPHWRLVPSPVTGDGIILACAPKKDPIYAIRAGGTGVLSDDAIAWVSDDAPEISADVPTPAFYEGDFFVLSDVRKFLSRVEPRTGRVKWKASMPGRAKYEASPLAADGKIYTINFDGDVVIFDAGTGAQINRISMDDPKNGELVRSSISVARGQLFIRTTRHLFCVGGG
jgi:outer membrane protein assembly factor BamB